MRKHYVLELSLFLLVLKFHGSYATKEVWSPASFPDPTSPVDRHRCGHPGSNLVCDPDRLLTTEDSLKLEKALADLEATRRTNCVLWFLGDCPGIHMGVAVGQSIDPTYADRSTYLDFPHMVSEKWGIKDIGIMLVYFTDERRLGITVGKYVEWSEADLDVTLDATKAFFGDGQLVKGALRIVADVKRVSPRRIYVPWDLIALIAGSVIVGLLIGAWHNAREKNKQLRREKPFKDVKIRVTAV
eukprot:170734_1